MQQLETIAFHYIQSKISVGYGEKQQISLSRQFGRLFYIIL